jgi:DNA-nicking Smr family endonuclease
MWPNTASDALLARMEDDPVRIPITDELDLHTFRPNEVGDLLVDYLGECQKLGILNVRVIHGKGTGTLRTGVHAALAKMEIVEEIIWPAGERSGGWGATWVRLKPL